MNVTFTGVGDNANVRHLDALSDLYPTVEWGILYSPRRAGTSGRYPSIFKIHSILTLTRPSTKFAIHMCGHAIDDCIQGVGSAVQLIEKLCSRPEGGRVQLNFNQQKRQYAGQDLTNLMDRYPTIEFITQHNSANSEVHKMVNECNNHSVLFDSSGGLGILGDWESPIPGVHCGYAGGLGPHNVASELRKIQAVAGHTQFWIDMETHVCNEDGLHIPAVVRTLTEIYPD